MIAGEMFGISAHDEGCLQDMVEQLPLGAFPLFKSTDEEDTHKYQTMFDDQPKGMGVLVSPRLLLRMSIERRRCHGQNCCFTQRPRVISCMVPGFKRCWPS